MKNKTLLICLDITIIFLTYFLMNISLNFKQLSFWLFIFIAFFEVIVSILIFKKIGKLKRKNEKKRLVKENNILIIISTFLFIIFLLSVNYIIDIKTEIKNSKEIWTEEVTNITIKYNDKDIILYVPSFSSLNGIVWNELVRFKNPKDAQRLKEEINNILNNEEYYEKIEVDNGVYYYNEDYDYTIKGYDIKEELVVSAFNYVICDGYCNN